MNRPRPLTKAEDVRETPPALYLARAEKCGGFTLDVCATAKNAKCSLFYTEADDGLARPWGVRNWCNPPFSDIAAWIAKAWRECIAGRPDLIEMLIPSTRTEQAWWQKMIEPHRDGRAPLVPGYALTTEFLAKRPRFLKDGVAMGSPKFGCVILHWERNGTGP